MRNHYNNFRCHCGGIANSAYGNGEIREDGRYKMEYFCEDHRVQRAKLDKIWETENFTPTTNEHGVLYLKPRGEVEDLRCFLDRHTDKQITLF